MSAYRAFRSALRGGKAWGGGAGVVMRHVSALFLRDRVPSRVRLTVGQKGSDGTKVQYCITAIEVS